MMIIIIIIVIFISSGRFILKELVFLWVSMNSFLEPGPSGAQNLWTPSISVSHFPVAALQRHLYNIKKPFHICWFLITCLRKTPCLCALPTEIWGIELFPGKLLKVMLSCSRRMEMQQGGGGRAVVSEEAGSHQRLGAVAELYQWPQCAHQCKITTSRTVWVYIIRLQLAS